MNKIFKAYIESKKSFNVILKSKTNPMYKSKYADISEIISAIETQLMENGLSFYHESVEPQNDGYIALQLVLIHESGESMKFGVCEFPAGRLAYRKDKQGNVIETFMEYTPQTFGSAMTYLRRYTLLSGFGLASEDDDGNHASSQDIQKQRYQQQQQQTKQIAEKIAELAKKTKERNILSNDGKVIDLNYIRDQLGYENLEEASYSKLENIKNRLLSKLVE